MKVLLISTHHVPSVLSIWMLFIAHGACIEVEIVMASWGSFMGHNVDASRMPNRSLRASVACCHLSQDETHFCSRPDLSSEFTPPNFRVCARGKVPAKHFKICHILYSKYYTKTQSCFFHFSFHVTLLFSLINALVLSLIHIWRCRRYSLCRSRWSPYH